MRIVSQDGNCNIPFEQVIIQRFGAEIYFLNANLMGVEGDREDLCIAKYSSEDKAIKAMKMLNKEWTDFGENGLFQFPHDNEIEVHKWL